MKYSLIVLIVLICSLVRLENPGLVGGLKLPIVNKIKEQYFETFMSDFTNIDIDTIDSGDITISGIQVEVENTDHNNVQVSFNQEKNGINVAVDNTYIKVHSNWKFEHKELGITIIKVTGVADIKSKISHVGMLIGFETQEKEGRLIPKINIQDFELNVDSSGFSPHIDCSVCPPGIIDLFAQLFKGELISKIESEARGVVNSKIADKVNEAFLEKYPLEITLGDDLSTSLANTAVVSVKEDYISVPLDATIFLTQEGYNRPIEAPEIPTESLDNPGEIQLYASTYLYETIEKAMNKIPLDIETQILGYDAVFKIDGTKIPLELKTQDQNLHAHIGGVLEIPGLKLTAEIGAETNIDINFRPGDATNMIYVDPDVNKDSLKFTMLKVTFYGWTINLTPFKWFINFVIGNAINFLVMPELPIAKLEALALTSTSAKVEFHDTYTEAGLAFNFGLDK